MNSPRRPGSIASRPLLSGLLAFGLGAFAAPHSGAAVLFLVNVSNPAAVTVTATDGKPLVSDLDFTLTNDGATLLDFFTANAGAQQGLLAGGSTLKPTASIHTYNAWRTDDYSTSGGADLDLNLRSTIFDINDTQDFVTTQQAFSGSATLNLSALSAFLPAPGTTGQILSGFSDWERDRILGEYTVVPEAAPLAQAAVFGLAAGSWLLLRRRRHAA
jgi:hypothetical protein